MSPGFNPRPSLNEQEGAESGRYWLSVAGVQPPAFVERGTTRGWRPALTSSVAGVQTPAFVERTSKPLRCRYTTPVSPGFNPRPSLSDRSEADRPAAKPGVAGVQPPAFVERAKMVLQICNRHMCRRGSTPGLR